MSVVPYLCLFAVGNKLTASPQTIYIYCNGALLVGKQKSVKSEGMLVDDFLRVSFLAVAYI